MKVHCDGSEGKKEKKIINETRLSSGVGMRKRSGYVPAIAMSGTGRGANVNMHSLRRVTCVEAENTAA